MTFLYFGQRARMLALLGSFACGLVAKPSEPVPSVSWWLTNRDRSVLCAQQARTIPLTYGSKASAATIRIDDAKPFQSIEGFGYALTGGSAELLMKMTAARRHTLLQQLFGHRPGDLGISSLRVGIGTTDLDSRIYTYDDMPLGQRDPDLRHFSMSKDEQYLIPVLREIRSIAPGVSLMASPWTAPAWMKQNRPLTVPLWRLEVIFVGVLFVALLLTRRRILQLMTDHALFRFIPLAIVCLFFVACQLWSLRYETHPRTNSERLKYFVRHYLFNGEDSADGQLQPRYASVYAKYLLLYLQQMHDRGIPIDSITLQNEPRTGDNRPSLQMSSAQQSGFIAQNFGPALRRSGLQTRLIIYDHNLDHPEYPFLILNDPLAQSYVDGSAFHMYAGQMSSMTSLHRAFPDKNLYFTEQMVIEVPFEGGLWPVGEPIERIVIGSMRNWSRNVILWNLASDSQLGPHIPDGGCPSCLGAVTIDGDRVARKNAYYTLAHIAPFVPAGSVRVDSNDTSDSNLANVAFRTSDGKTVLLVVNSSHQAQTFTVQNTTSRFEAELPYLSVATFVIPAPVSLKQNKGAA